MSRKSYPEWGLFGGDIDNITPDSPKSSTSTSFSQAQHSQRRNNADDRKRYAGQRPEEAGSGLQIDLVIKIGGIEITTEEADSPEQIEAAIRTAHDLAATTSTPSNATNPALRLLNCIHPLKGFIEQAMDKVNAVSFDDVEAVWRQLVAIADADAAPEHVIGYSPDRRAIKYQGRGYDRSGQFDYFNRDALAELFRRQKAHAKPRSPTSSHDQ